MRTPARSYAFQNGELHLASEQGERVLSGWPVLTAKKRDIGETRWSPYWPDFKLILPHRSKPAPADKRDDPQPCFDFDLEPLDASPRLSPTDQREQAFAAFRHTVPEDVAAVVERFQLEQLALLRLIRDDPLSLGLAASNAALTFGLACRHYVPSRRRESPSQSFGNKKQKELAPLIGFPAETWAVNILRKVPPESVNSGRLNRLVAVLGEPDTRTLLSHLSSINAGVIEVVCSQPIRGYVAPTLLKEIAANDRELYKADTASLLTDTVNMADVLEPDHGLRFATLAQLKRVHDRLAAEYCRADLARCGGERFPRPPKPGIPGVIVPIRTVSDLASEGRDQANCVASYAANVAEGACYIYRVLRPERATLSVVREANRRWRIGELKLAGNKVPSPQTCEFVDSWFEKSFSSRK